MLKSRSKDGKLLRQTSWPSGLRRCVQVAVLIGAGSNPADVIYFLGPVTCLLAFGARRQVQYHRVYPSGPPWLHSLALDFCPSFVSARFFTSGRRSSSAGSLIASAHFFAPLVRSSGPGYLVPGSFQAKERVIYTHREIEALKGIIESRRAVFLGDFSG